MTQRCSSRRWGAPEGHAPRARDPNAFEVTVTEGVATIKGAVDRRSSAEMIARTAVLVPGVRDVVSDVRWMVDDAELKSGTPGPEFPFSPQ